MEWGSNKKEKISKEKYFQTVSQEDREEHNKQRHLAKNTVWDAKRNTWQEFGSELQENYGRIKTPEKGDKKKLYQSEIRYNQITLLAYCRNKNGKKTYSC